VSDFARLDVIHTYGGVYLDMDVELVAGDILILSNDYITSYSGEAGISNARLGIHWHNGGWLDDKDRKNINASMEAREPLTRKYFK